MSETFEKCKNIRNYMLRNCAETMLYKNWDSDFATENIREIPDVSDGSFRGSIDPTLLSKDEMIDLGFMKYRDDFEMLLIPLWLFPFLKDGFKCQCINGKKKIFIKSKMDVDHRSGMLSYGIILNA